MKTAGENDEAQTPLLRIQLIKEHPESCTLDQQDRPRCPADQHLGHLEQPGERQHRGLQKARAIFEDLLYQNINQPGGRSSADTRLPFRPDAGAGAKVVATQKNHSQGNVQTTDNSLI